MIDEHQILRKAIRFVHLFEGFSEQDARDFIAWSTRVDAEAGEAVVREGESGQDMFVVVAGRLSVVKGGAELELAALEPGDSFGEIALLDSGPRSASVVALVDSTLLRFERRNLVKIPEVSLKLYRNIATMVAVRLRDTNARVALAKTAPVTEGAGETERVAGSERVISRIG